MTTIKCRYTAPICLDGHTDRMENHDCFGEWNDHDFCNDGTDSHELREKGEPRVMCQPCLYAHRQRREFEKTVKRYSYNENGLCAGGKLIPDESILYLEIDGRVLIDEEGGEE